MLKFSFDRKPLVCARTMIALLTGACYAVADDDHAPGDRVQSWAIGQTSHLPANTRQYSNQTIREIVHTSVGGSQVRVRISNTFGSAPLLIGEAHVAVTSSGSSIVPGTDRALTFGGRTSVTIPAGAPAVSDPVDLYVQPVSDIAVSIYLPSATPGETTTFLQGNSFISSPGNFTGSVNLSGATALSEWPFVSGVSVLTSRPGHDIVAITDLVTPDLSMAEGARRSSELSTHGQSRSSKHRTCGQSAAFQQRWTDRTSTAVGAKRIHTV